MLAGDVADDRTKATFVRVHARDLGDVVDHEAEKLNDADANRANVAVAKTKAIDLADKIDTALGQIQVAPDDAPGARKADPARPALQAGRRPIGGPVKGILQLALGIIAAIGGFVDIGDLVFNSQAGATVRLPVLWAIPVGVLGIMVFAEMSGRIVAVVEEGEFRAGARSATGSGCGVHAGRVAGAHRSHARRRARRRRVRPQLFFDVSAERLHAGRDGRGSWRRSAFCRSTGSSGSSATWGWRCWSSSPRRSSSTPDWSDVGNGFVPSQQPPCTGTSRRSDRRRVHAVRDLLLLVWRSRGGLDARGPRRQQGQRIIGYGLGGLLGRRLPAGGRRAGLQPAGSPRHLGTRRSMRPACLRRDGLILALVGILFAIGGAAIDTCFSAAYNLAQYQGWEWGKEGPRSRASRWRWPASCSRSATRRLDRDRPDRADRVRRRVLVAALPLTYLPILLVGATERDGRARQRPDRARARLGLLRGHLRDDGRRAGAVHRHQRRRLG